MDVVTLLFEKRLGVGEGKTIGAVVAGRDVDDGAVKITEDGPSATGGGGCWRGNPLWWLQSGGNNHR